MRRASQIVTWDQWVSDPTVDKVYLVEAQVSKLVEGVPTPTTLYWATKGVVFNKTPYLPCIDTLPRRSVKAQELFTGRSMASWGNLELLNGEGELDPYLDSYIFNGGTVVVKAGGAALPYTEYKTIFTGIMGAPTWDRRMISIPLEDQQAALDRKMVPVNEYATATNMPATTVGKAILVPYGVCRAIPAQCIDDVNHIYQFSDLPVYAITAVYINGVVDTTYTGDAANGKLSFPADPGGAVTVSVQGVKNDAGTDYLKTIGEITYHLLTTYGSLTAGDFETGALAALDAAFPYTLGLALVDKESVFTVLDKLFAGNICWWTFNREGKFTCGALVDPATVGLTVAQALDKARIYTPKVAHTAKVPWKIRVNYQKNWAGVVNEGAATEEDRAFFANEWRSVSVEDSAIEELIGGAIEKGPLDSYIDDPDDAAEWAATLLVLLGLQRQTAQVTIKQLGFDLDLGQVVELTYDRWNWSTGKKFILVGIEESWSPTWAQLILWG